jgi:predicted ATP-grasp superfamily ATP-dependent carboligase
MAGMAPADLYRLEPDRPELDRPVLVQALNGFVDAGGAVRLAREHLLAALDHRVVATFDVDQLIDYRSRRPPMLFVEDHWEHYEDPQLAVRLVWDSAGVPFLLLDGPEPDVRWERFVGAVRAMIAQLDVRLTVGLNAIPMAVPHTRPVGITAHATRRQLVSGFRPWVSTVTVPASAGHLLEYRLGQHGLDAVGFAAHVPHYVAQLDYPLSAAVLLESVAAVSGLALPTDGLRSAAETVRGEIDAQVAQSAEVAAVVHGLEEQYDSFTSDHRDLLADPAARLPTADELGAELERFLSEQRERGDSADG